MMTTKDDEDDDADVGTEADKGQSQNISKSKKNWKSHFFWQISVEEFLISEILLQILLRLLDPQITFRKFENSFQSKNRCEIQKNILKLQII